MIYHLCFYVLLKFDISMYQGSMWTRWTQHEISYKPPVIKHIYLCKGNFSLLFYSILILTRLFYMLMAYKTDKHRATQFLRNCYQRGNWQANSRGVPQLALPQPPDTPPFISMKSFVSTLPWPLLHLIMWEDSFQWMNIIHDTSIPLWIPRAQMNLCNIGHSW